MFSDKRIFLRNSRSRSLRPVHSQSFFLGPPPAVCSFSLFRAVSLSLRLRLAKFRPRAGSVCCRCLRPSSPSRPAGKFSYVPRLARVSFTFIVRRWLSWVTHVGFALSLGETCFSKGGVITLLTSCVAGPLLSTYCRSTRRVFRVTRRRFAPRHSQSSQTVHGEGLQSRYVCFVFVA